MEESKKRAFKSSDPGMDEKGESISFNSLHDILFF